MAKYSQEFKLKLWNITCLVIVILHRSLFIYGYISLNLILLLRLNNKPFEYSSSTLHACL